VSARHKARKAAFDLLYSAEQRGQTLTEALSDYRAREAAKRETLTEFDYVAHIVSGVEDNAGAIDAAIVAHLKDWTMPRLFAVDRAILRIATWEILFSDTPADVVRAEALTLAGEFGSDDAVRFIGGVLGAIVRDLPQLQ